MRVYDVHFKITGFYRLEAETPEEATKKTNEIINECINEIESILCCGLKDDNYVFDVVAIDQ